MDYRHCYCLILKTLEMSYNEFMDSVHYGYFILLHLAMSSCMKCYAVFQSVGKFLSKVMFFIFN